MRPPFQFNYIIDKKHVQKQQIEPAKTRPAAHQNLFPPLFHQNHLQLRQKINNITKSKFKNMQVECSQKQNITKLKQTLHHKITFIHSVLTKIGYPNIPTSAKQCQQKMSIYFQASDYRLELVEWLIAVVYPGYKLDEEYRSVYDDDPHLHRVKKYAVVLWQLGVMPVSKFTKNLDYIKYIQGLIGYESSVNLVYQLAQLADAKYSPNITHIEQVAGDLLGDLIRNHNQLVNVDYDPYGVIFPAKYYQNRDQDLPVLNQLYDEMLAELAQGQNKVSDQPNKDMDEANRLLGQLDGYKELFNRKYDKLSKAIQATVTKYEPLVPADNQQISQLHERRVLNISKTLCKKYRAYKKQTQTIKQPQFTANLKQIKNQVLLLIDSINNLDSI